MINEFERYHGVVIRELVVGCGLPVNIEAVDDLGRINTFIVNRRIGIYIKHSSKRLPPWQFTYQADHVAEVERLSKRSDSVWLVHACGQDGLAALSYADFIAINPMHAETTSFVRVDRERNTMYRVNGTGAKLRRPKRRGLDEIFDEMRA
jgi:hypothetical protein